MAVCCGSCLLSAVCCACCATGTCRAHLLAEHGIETAHQLKDAVPADCADSEDCPSTLSALMNNENGSEITQNGLRFLQKEYDEKGLTHPDDADDAGEFTVTKGQKQQQSKDEKTPPPPEEEEAAAEVDSDAAGMEVEEEKTAEQLQQEEL